MEITKEEETARKMNLCLTYLEQGLKKQDMARELGVSNQYITHLFQKMEEQEEFKKRKDEIMLWKNFEKWRKTFSKKCHRSYIKNLKTYQNAYPIYAYIVKNHATYEMAMAHFDITLGTVQCAMRKIRRVAPGATDVLNQVIQENLHNTHRVNGKKKEGSANNMNWEERSMIHINYIIENNCSIQDARNCLGASVMQIGNDIYRMLSSSDEKTRKKAYDAYCILLNHTTGGCSYVDYRGKRLSKTK